MAGSCYCRVVNILTRESIAQRLLFLGMIAFFAGGFLGLTHFAMATGPDGQMSNCPFMGVAALCQMNPLQHIAEWQKFFTALPPNNWATILIIASFILLAVRGLKYIGRTDPPLMVSLRLQLSSISFLSCKDPLQEAFSSGILNPKAF